MTDLSPAARAAWEAFNQFDHAGMHVDYGVKIAAALRAAADQVVPEVTTPWNSTLTPIVSVGEIRAKLLSIATELEGAND